MENSEDNATSADSRPDSSSPKKQLLLIFRLVVLACVIAALAYTVIHSWKQLSETSFRISRVNWVAWGGAVISYLSAMLLACIFWHRILIAMGQKPVFFRSLLAFYTSQLGKYVPGKAMVVVMRTDIVRGPGVKIGPAAASVFVETLTWIFVGSVIACLLLSFQVKNQPVLQVTAWALAIVAGILTSPPVFRKVATIILRSKSGGTQFLDGLNLQAMSTGWGLMSIGWILNGASLWLVIYGMPETGIELSDFWLTLTCVSLATVAGFVSLLPGGLGVRELVMIPLLGSRFGVDNALIAAIVIRLVWLASELVSSAIMYMIHKRTVAS